MNLRIKKPLVSLILTLLLISLFSSSALAYTKTCNIPRVTQAKSNWCWAACDEMDGKWAYYDTSTRTQWDVVWHVKGWPWDPYPNEPGNIYETEDGAEYVTYDNKAFFNNWSPFSLAAIRDRIGLQPGKPFIALISSGHMVVVNGADYTLDRVGYVDPLNGTMYWVNYSDFCSGAIQGGDYIGNVYY